MGDHLAPTNEQAKLGDNSSMITSVESKINGDSEESISLSPNSNKKRKRELPHYPVSSSLLGTVDMAAKMSSFYNAMMPTIDVLNSVSGYADISKSIIDITLAQKSIVEIIPNNYFLETANIFLRGQVVSETFANTLFTQNILDSGITNLFSENIKSIAAIMGKAIELNSGIDASAYQLIPEMADLWKHPTFTEVVANSIKGIDISGLGRFQELNLQLAQESLAAFSFSQNLGVEYLQKIAHLPNTDLLWREQAEKTLSYLGKITTGIKRTELVHNSALQLSNSSLAEIARTFTGYFSNVMINLGQGSSIGTGLEIYLPTRVTYNYVHSIYQPVSEGLNRDEFDDTSLQDSFNELDELFKNLGPQYFRMWKGSWSVLRSDSPDQVRQAASSVREILTQFLDQYAPDTAFEKTEVERNGKNGKITRVMRARKILANRSNSAGDWVDAMAKAIEESYSRFSAICHDRSENPAINNKQAESMLIILGGLIKFLYDAKR